MSKTLDGKLAGLQRASALRDEMISHRQREIEVFESVSTTKVPLKLENHDSN